MKYIFLVISLICGFSHFSASQNFKTQNLKSGNKEFNISREHNFVIIMNSDNKIVDKGHKLPDRLVQSGYEQYLNYTLEDAAKILSLVSEEYRRLDRKIPSERPVVVYYIGETGEILEMKFLLRENTTLTIDDVRIIEDVVKKGFKFKTDSKMLSGAGYVTWATRINLQDISKN